MTGPGAAQGSNPERIRVRLRRLGPSERGETELDLPRGALVQDALRAAGVRRETVLVASAADKRILPDDAPLEDGDCLLVTRVVTGGAGSARGGADRGA